MFESNFVSAIMGAIVGGAIAAIVQWFGVRASARLEAERELRLDAAIYASVILKVMRIIQCSQSLSEELEAAYEAASPKMEPWQFAKPRASYPDQIHFDGPELAVSSKAKGQLAANNLIRLEYQYNHLIASFQLYSTIHDDFLGFLPLEINEDDQVDYDLSLEMLRRAKFKALNVNSLANQLREKSLQMLNDASTIYERIRK